MVTSKIGPMGVDQRRLLDEILGNLNRGNLDFLVRVFFSIDFAKFCDRNNHI